MIKVIVPATSANLGPGFDTLGVALNLFNTYTFEKESQFRFTGVDKVFQSVSTNLVAKSYIKAFEKANREVIPAYIDAKTEVPVSRGLGSSACCIIGGIVGANQMMGNPLSTDDLLALATEIEGHPDNVAPCFLGGCVASFMEQGKLIYVKYPVSEDLIFNTFIPDFPLLTSESRKVLKKVYSIEELVFNCSHLINIPYALRTGNIDLLYHSMQDCVHQPFRFPIIEEANLFVNYAKERKIPLVLSGAGPTLLAITKEETSFEISTSHVWEKKELRCNQKGVEVIVQ